MDVAYRNQAPVLVLGITSALDGVAPDVLKEDCGGGSTAKEISHTQVPTFLLEFRRVDPKQPDAGSPDTGGPLALAVHNQRITVRYAYRAGNIGMGGEGEQRHQGGGRAERDGQDDGQASGHGGMVPPRQDQTKARAFDSPGSHRQYRGP